MANGNVRLAMERGVFDVLCRCARVAVLCSRSRHGSAKHFSQLRGPSPVRKPRCGASRPLPEFASPEGRVGRVAGVVQGRDESAVADGEHLQRILIFLPALEPNVLDLARTQRTCQLVECLFQARECLARRAPGRSRGPRPDLVQQGRAVVGTDEAHARRDAPCAAIAAATTTASATV